MKQNVIRQTLVTRHPPAAPIAPNATTPTLTPCAGGPTFLNQTITNTLPTIPNVRLVQTGIASTCAASKTFPGTTGTGNRHYRQYTLTNNTVSTQCVTITFLTQCGPNTNLTSV